MVQLTVTSPLYRNTINYELHSRSRGGPYYRGNLRRSTGEYFREVAEILREVYRVTRDGGYAAFVIGNEVVDGNLNPLPHILATRLTKT